MKKLLKISYLALAFLFFCTLTASAQIKPSTKKKTDAEPAKEQQDDYSTPTSTKKKTTAKTDSYFDESGGFKHRLWYGGNFILGLSSNSYGSSFAIGVTPMVGYKIIGGWSVGPRLGVTYNSQGFNGVRINWTDYAAGAFTRLKFLETFFLHAEYGYSSKGIGIDQFAQIVKENRVSPAFGGGYNSGNGLFGYEIALLYDPSLANNAYVNPLDIRAGFTYKF
jgi:hypothetical protein